MFVSVPAIQQTIVENAIAAGRAFAGSVVLPALASKRSHVQLFNPSGSGIQIQVLYLEFQVTGASQVTLRFYDTALLTDAATERNLLSGGAGAVGQLRTMQNSLALGTEIYNMRAAATTRVIAVARPFAVLPAATGILLHPQTNNIGITAAFEWREATA